jgi:hypothetical protein
MLGSSSTTRTNFRVVTSYHLGVAMVVGAETFASRSGNRNCSLCCRLQSGNPEKRSSSIAT